MVADVGYSYMAHRTDEAGGMRNDMITRDLLGESFSRQLDVHLQLPATGWPENCLDLVESGKIYLQKCRKSEPNRPASSSSTRHLKRQLEEIHSNLNLKSSNIQSSSYLSVCTLDKVKTALDREKHDQFVRRNLSIPTTCSNSATSSSCGASMITNEATLLNLEATSMSSSEERREGALKLSVAGCSNCLMYVMISNENPKCPKCYSSVSLPVAKKKLKIDLSLNL